MPLPLAAGAAIIGAGINAFSQGKMNQKTRQWNEKMYGIQRQHALDDWAMQNAYNSPEQQMMRLKAAGLNPNMVYGSGSVANSTQSPRSSSTGSWNPQSPDFGSIATSGIFAGLDMEIKQQQLDNLKTQKTVMDTDVLRKTADIANLNVKTERGKFDLGLVSDLRNTTLTTAQENLRNIRARTDVALAANERAIVTQGQSLRESAERILNMRLQRAKSSAEISQIQANIANLRRSGALQELDIAQRKLGINPNSNTAVQMVGRLINSDVLPQVGQKIDRGLKWHKNWVAPFSKQWFNR